MPVSNAHQHELHSHPKMLSDPTSDKSCRPTKTQILSHPSSGHDNQTIPRSPQQSKPPTSMIEYGA